MDFFILFAAMGLVALSRITIGLGGMPKADLAVAIDWAAVHAQILTSLGAEAVASRTQREAVDQRRMAKRHRRWVRRADLAEGRAQALAAAKVARLEVRKAAKAAKLAKSAEVAARYGHAAQRAAAAVKAHRRLVAAGLTVSPAISAGIKARKRATRGSTSEQLAAKRQTRLTAAQQRNAADRAAADAANAAFAAQRAVKAADRKAAEKAAARSTALADLLANRNAVKLAHAVVRAGAKATAKEDFLQWLDANGHNSRGAAWTAANQAAWTAAKAEEGYLAHFGFSAETIVAADKAAFEWRSVQRAARQGKAVAA